MDDRELICHYDGIWRCNKKNWEDGQKTCPAAVKSLHGDCCLYFCRQYGDRCDYPGERNNVWKHKLKLEGEK